MRNFEIKRMCVSAAILVLLVAAVTTSAKGTQLIEGLNQVDSFPLEDAKVQNQPRTWRICHSGKCTRRRNKRGMKRTRPELFEDLQDYEAQEDSYIKPEETRTQGKAKRDY